MSTMTIEVIETDYVRLAHAAEHVGKPVSVFLHELICQLPDTDTAFDATQDPLFNIEGYDSDAPPDLSLKIDRYLYDGEEPK